MLKHNEIISKLSDIQKIRIIANLGNLSGKDFKILGIPSIKPGYMKDYSRGKYPHAVSLAHSWDSALWAEVASARAAEMAADGVDLFITPGPKTKISPYRKEMSEDSYLSYRMAAAQAASVGRYGGVGALSGYYLTEAESEWLDTNPSKRVINEEIVRPYAKALRAAGARVVLTDTRALQNEYADVPKEMRSAMASEVEYLVCIQATDENTVELVNEGVICLSASANALESARSRYDKIKQQMDRGTADESKLIDEVRAGSALSPQALDEALDKVLSFIYACRAGGEKMAAAPSVSNPLLAYKAALSSTVLLKNRSDLLPISGEKRIGVIGNLDSRGDEAGGILSRCRAALDDRGYVCSGACPGYGDDGQREMLKNNALKLAKESDVLVLLLGVRYADEKEVSKNEILSLPANQLYLVHELSKMGKPMVAVISDAYSADVAFSRQVDALLLAPLEAEGGIDALADIIGGIENPSGKLAYTLYAGAETAFNKRAMYKREYGIKSGPFIGYKYYDTAGLQLGYPFGYGLSYSTFEYSSIAIEGSKVSFEVKNTSEIKGVEIAEIYLGKSDSSVIRPKKVLCGFARIELAPGQKKKISYELDVPPVYTDEGYAVEGGAYTVYIGSSVSDIRLSAGYTVKGGKLKADGERLIDYIQSMSNIKEDKFTLEAGIKPMKKSYKNIIFGISAIVLAIGLSVFNTVMELSSVFLGLVTMALAVGAIVFFVMEAKERNLKYQQERARIDEANKAHFEGAETVTGVNASKLFHDEFDAQDKAVVEEANQVEEYLDEQIAEYLDSRFTISDAVSEFLQFANEKGYKFNRGSVENLLASMASSKLIVTAMPDDEFNSCILLLSQYFGTETYVDNYGSAGEDKSDTFFAHDANGDKVRKNIMLALAAAAGSPEKIVISATRGVGCDAIHHIITPFARYISAQRDKNSIEIYNKVGANIGYTIAPNLWLVINLASGESVTRLPISIARSAALCSLVFSKGKKADTHSNIHGLNRYQLRYLADKARVSEISEDMWKKVDKLEKYAREYSDYNIGNKLWRNFEKHISILIACGLESSDAADAAMATRLLPSIAVAVSSNLTKDDQGILETLEFIFGSENIAVSRETVKTLLTVDVKKADGNTAEA